MKKRVGLVISAIGVILAGCTTVESSTGPSTTVTTSTILIEEESAAGRTQVEQVVRHIDGDTLELSSHGVTRLIGVDTPETVHPNKPQGCYGPESADWTKSQLPIGTEVRTVEDKEPKDRYDRSLAYVYRVQDGMFVNGELVRQGYAKKQRIPPNTSRAEAFADFEQEASEAKRGLWGKCL